MGAGLTAANVVSITGSVTVAQSEVKTLFINTTTTTTVPANHRYRVIGSVISAAGSGGAATNGNCNIAANGITINTLEVPTQATSSFTCNQTAMLPLGTQVSVAAGQSIITTFNGAFGTKSAIIYYYDDAV